MRNSAFDGHGNSLYIYVLSVKLVYAVTKTSELGLVFLFVINSAIIFGGMIMRITADLSEELVEKLGVTTGEFETNARFENNALIFSGAERVNEEKQQRSIRFAIGSAVIAAIISLIIFSTNNLNLIKMTGGYSITQLAIYIGVSLSFIGFGYYAIQAKRKGQLNVHWLNIVTLTLAYTVISFIGLSLLMWAVTSAFAGARLDIYTASVIVGLFVAVATFGIITVAQTISFSQIITALIATLVCGIMFTMITNGSAGWWEHNFSYLGTKGVGDSWIFNFTLIFSALIMLALIDYIFSELDASFSKQRRLFFLRILFSLTAITLGGVGAIPNYQGWMHVVHDNLAQMLGLWILIMIVCIRWLIPTLTREFLLTSYLLGGGLILSEFLFQGIHYLSLTAFELVSFGIAFSWIILLLQNLQGMFIKRQGQVILKIVDSSSDNQ